MYTLFEIGIFSNTFFFTFKFIIIQSKSASLKKYWILKKLFFKKYPVSIVTNMYFFFIFFFFEKINTNLKKMEISEIIN